MEKQMAKNKLATLIDNGKLNAVPIVINFLEGSISQEDLNELIAFSDLIKEAYLKELEEKKKKEDALWHEARNRVLEARFSWDEIMEILEDAGGVITFRTVGKSGLFSRYDRYGHLIAMIERDIFSPLEHYTEKVLTPYKEYQYKIDSYHSNWNDLTISTYLEERAKTKV